MLQPLSFDEFLRYTKSCGRTAVFQSIPAGKLTPHKIYTLFSNLFQEEGVILENLHVSEVNRYSYICFNPISSLALNAKDETCVLTALREFQKKFAYKTRDEVVELITNEVGFITYDAIRYFENIPDQHAENYLLPEILFNSYALSVTFDHDKQSILISLLVETSEQPLASYEAAQQELKRIIEYLTNSNIEDIKNNDSQLGSSIDVDISDANFVKMVEKAKDYIIRGDAFQVVLSRCFKRPYSIPPFAIYKTLCAVSPAPFMFYFPIQSGAIIGASPERLVRINNKHVTVNPIAGTRKHIAANNIGEITADLLNDKKELAEHMMLVDLARNDVGSVSEPGSVEVTELLHVKHYSHVSHITSTVTGKLQEKYDAYDAFAAVFPAGTLSGAPKIRAMQIIDELETSRRGLYGGALCRLDAAGNLDSCIAIRMAVLQAGIATIRAGAGIVFDSNPAKEMEETHQKAKSMLDAIDRAHGG